MRRFRSPIWMVLSLLLIAPLIATTQFGDCEAIVKTALDATKEVCSSTSRNQACYGHVLLDAQPQPGVAALQFNTVGDKVDLTEIDSLRLSPMDVVNGTWGVALVELQADIPAEQKDANVSLLLFGDVEVKNAVRNLVTMNVTIPGKRNVNVRRQPDNQSFVMGTLKPGDTVVANGRSDDNQWISINLPDDGGQGWVNSSLIQGENDLSTLNTVRPDLAGYGPMQAFYLQTGSDQSSCAQASNDGILIQTPEGVAEVRLWINEVRIRLGSTAFIQTDADNQMIIKTVEGHAHVEALGIEQDVPAGTGVTVQLNDSFAPIAPPSQAEAYKSEDVSNLPVQNLDRQITIAPPLEAPPIPSDEPTLVEPTAEPTDEVFDIHPDDPSTDAAATGTPIVLSLTPETTKKAPQFQPTDTPQG